MADFDKLVNDKPVSENGGTEKKNTVLQDTYTDEEIHDVNNITVTIPDASTPIVVFFGSPASGKTLTLLRMIRFLEQNNYQVVPEALFRPQTDKHYTKMCAGLKDMAYSTYAPGGVPTLSASCSSRCLTLSDGPYVRFWRLLANTILMGMPVWNFPLISMRYVRV